MTNFLSPLRKPVKFESVRWFDSQTTPGVRFAVREPSLSKRIDLTRQLNELTLRHEFLASGGELQQLELTLAELLVQKLLIEWGLATIENLRIDGKAANAELLIEAGPEQLVVEIAAAIKKSCSLDEEERKNS